jgi:hypothetical protein
MAQLECLVSIIRNAVVEWHKYICIIIIIISCLQNIGMNE